MSDFSAKIPISNNSLVNAFRVHQAQTTLEYITERGQAIREIEQLAKECEEKGVPLPEPEPPAPPPPVPESCPISKELYENMNQEVQEPPSDAEKAELKWIRDSKPLIDSIPLPHLVPWAQQIKEKSLTRDIFLRAPIDQPHVAAPFFLSSFDDVIRKKLNLMLPNIETYIQLFQPPHAIVYICLSHRHFVWTVLYAPPPPPLSPYPHSLRGRIMYENEKKENAICGLVVEDSPKTDEYLRRFVELMRSRMLRGFLMSILSGYRTNKKLKKKFPNARRFVTVPEDCLFDEPLYKMARLNHLPHFKTKEAIAVAENLPSLSSAIKANQFHKHKRVVVLLHGVQCNVYTILDCNDLDAPKLHYRGFVRRQDNTTQEVTHEQKDFTD